MSLCITLFSLYVLPLSLYVSLCVSVVSYFHIYVYIYGILGFESLLCMDLRKRKHCVSLPLPLISEVSF